VEVVLARHQYYLSFFLGHFVDVFLKVSNSGQADTAFSFGVNEGLDVELLKLPYSRFGGWWRTVIVGVVVHYVLHYFFQALVLAISESQALTSLAQEQL
jgi:hypothetical protein